MRLACTTASFLPATAWSTRSILELLAWSTREGFAAPELLLTRAAHRLTHRSVRWTSVHEVWNPRISLWSEIRSILAHTPQSRGMTPSWVDTLFFRDGPESEQRLFECCSHPDIIGVVSALESPFGSDRFKHPNTAIQLHPELGTKGDFLPLEAIADEVQRRDARIVLDTYHVRRRVRRHPAGRTEIAPPVDLDPRMSLGGIKAVWDRLHDRTALIHLQFADRQEVDAILRQDRWSQSLRDAIDLMPEWKRRNIPVVLELNPGWFLEPHRGPVHWRRAMQSRLCRIRDRVLATCR